MENQTNSPAKILDVFLRVMPVNTVNLQQTLHAIASTHRPEVACALFDLLQGSCIAARLRLACKLTELTEADIESFATVGERWIDLMAISPEDEAIALKLGVYPELAGAVLANQARELARRPLRNLLGRCERRAAAMGELGLVAAAAKWLAEHPKMTPDLITMPLPRRDILELAEHARPDIFEDHPLGSVPQTLYRDLLDRVPGDLGESQI